MIDAETVEDVQVDIEMEVEMEAEKEEMQEELVIEVGHLLEVEDIEVEILPMDLLKLIIRYMWQDLANELLSRI